MRTRSVNGRQRSFCWAEEASCRFVPDCRSSVPGFLSSMLTPKLGGTTSMRSSKVTAMERLGAEVLFHGTSFDAAREHAESLAADEGYRYVHSANEPALIAGVGTAGLKSSKTVPRLITYSVRLTAVRAPLDTVSLSVRSRMQRWSKLNPRPRQRCTRRGRIGISIQPIE